MTSRRPPAPESAARTPLERDPATTGRLDGGPRRPANRSPLERAQLWAFLAFVATLTWEWVTLGGLAGGFVKPFHLSAFVVIALCLARWRPRRLVLPVLRRHIGVYGAYFLLLALVAALTLAHEQPYRPHSDVIRQVFYAGTSVVVAGLFLRTAGRRAQRVLAWAGVVTVVALAIALVSSLAAQHVNPLAVLGEALAKRDPDIISYRLLRFAFRTEEDLASVGANLRHKVFGALLLAMFLGLAFQPLASRRRSSRALLTAGAVVGCGLVLLSLSRSVIGILAATLLLAPSRAIVSKRAAPRQAAALGLLAVLILALVFSPVGGLLYSRFASSGSYVSRIAALGSGFAAALGPAVLLGAEASDVTAPPHNVVLDSWLRGGVAAAICAVVVLVCYAHVWLREVRRYMTARPGWVLPLAHQWVLGIGVIPLVRAFTAGNQAHMIEWTAIGLFLGLTYANQRQATLLASEDEKPDSLAASPPVMGSSRHR